MKHYICTGGCKTIAENSGVCVIDSCPKKGIEMEGCECFDGNHHGAFDFNHDHEASLPEIAE